jgi:hypothetical protein
MDRNRRQVYREALPALSVLLRLEVWARLNRPFSGLILTCFFYGPELWNYLLYIRKEVLALSYLFSLKKQAMEAVWQLHLLCRF